jgi:UDP-N-acetylglucosamine 2-epimerase (non-hydrolysing)
MKLAPVYRAIVKIPEIEQLIVHTGQHYDFNMSDVFFQQLGVGAPDINLQVGSASHAKQTAEIMVRFETVLLEQRPDLVLVYGDVNSTVAAALVCSKLGVRVGHVEAGLRSCDRSMPEEINRLLTDQLADLLFTPSEDGNRNLVREGIPSEKVFLVGNVMIDTLIHMLPACQTHVPVDLPSRFALLTLHRPANVDDLDWLKCLLQSLEQISSDLTILFPVHPRTRQRINDIGIDGSTLRLRLMEPQPYLTFLALQQRAVVVITDSGGIQEETTYLQVPCLTVRENTERPITVEMGTNILVGRDPQRIRQQVERILFGHTKRGQVPPLWDGHAAERIAEIIAKLT